MLFGNGWGCAVCVYRKGGNTPSPGAGEAHKQLNMGSLHTTTCDNGDVGAGIG